MKAQPILFSDEMVRALLADRKTETRRVLWTLGRTRSVISAWPEYPPPSSANLPFAHQWRPSRWANAAPGDVLYVREACRAVELKRKAAIAAGQEPGVDGIEYMADNAFRPINDTTDAAAAWLDLNHYGEKRGHSNRRGRTVPAIHMPRWASRLTLVLTMFHVERLQSIDDASARREGVEGIAEYFELWRRINGPESFDDNPWVIALTFTVQRQNVDDFLGTT